MNELFATWHHSRSGVVEHLTQAHCQLLDMPGLEAALAMVDAAIAQVSRWLDQQGGTPRAEPSWESVDLQGLFQPAFEGGADHAAG